MLITFEFFYPNGESILFTSVNFSQGYDDGSMLLVQCDGVEVVVASGYRYFVQTPQEAAE